MIQLLILANVFLPMRKYFDVLVGQAENMELTADEKLFFQKSVSFHKKKKEKNKYEA